MLINEKLDFLLCLFIAVMHKRENDAQSLVCRLHQAILVSVSAGNVL